MDYEHGVIVARQNRPVVSTDNVVALHPRLLFKGGVPTVAVGR
jgi:hypothetical protein